MRPGRGVLWVVAALLLSGVIAGIVGLRLLAPAQPGLTGQASSGPTASVPAMSGGAAGSAVTSASGTIVVDDAWARAATRPSDGSTATSAVYLTLRNLGSAGDRLLGATSDAAATTEIHRTTVEDGVMRMRPAGVVDVPGSDTLRLQPGGLHVMLIDLHHDLTAGDGLTLTLQFERAGPVTVRAEVRSPTSPPMQGR